MTEINVPRLRFSGFDEVWEENKIGNLALVTKLAGFEFSKYVSYSDEGNIIALRGLNVKNDSLDLRDVKYIDDSDFSKLKRSKLFIGDILFTYVGTVGNSAIVKENNKFYLAPNVALIRIKDKELSSYFFQKEISTNRYFRKVVYPLAASSSQMALSMESIRKFKFWYCSIDEQERIGSFFAKIDKIIELQTQKLEQLNKLKRGYLQKMFPQDGESVPRLRFSGFSGDWKEEKLKETLKVGKSGGTPSTKNKEYYDGTIPFLSIKDVTESNGIINDTEKHINNDAIQNSSSWIVPKGSLTISMYASIGSVAKFSSDVATSQAFFNMIFNDGIDVDFMYHFFNQYNLMGRWKRLIATGTQGNLNATEINNILVRIPSEEEQLKIASLLSKLDQVINEQSKKIKVLKQQKKAYLQKMFL